MTEVLYTFHDFGFTEVTRNKAPCENRGGIDAL